MKAIENALEVWLWAINPSRGTGPDARQIEVEKLQASYPYFRSGQSSDFDAAVENLQAIGVLSTVEIKNGGRLGNIPVRHVSADYIPSQAHPLPRIEEVIKQKLSELLAQREFMVKHPTTQGVDIPDLRVLRRYFFRHGAVYFWLEPGQIIRDYHQKVALKKQNAPVTEVNNVKSVQCANPRCKHNFEMDQGGTPSAPVLIAIKGFGTPYGVNFLRFEKEQLITDANLVRHLLARKAPVVIARADEYSICPKCAKVFRHSQQLGDQEITNRLQSAVN